MSNLLIGNIHPKYLENIHASPIEKCSQDNDQLLMLSFFELVYDVFLNHQLDKKLKYKRTKNFVFMFFCVTNLDTFFDRPMFILFKNFLSNFYSATRCQYKNRYIATLGPISTRGAKQQDTSHVYTSKIALTFFHLRGFCAM